MSDPLNRVKRPQCSVFIATSLDGFIARANGAIDWLDVVQRPGEDYGFRAFYDSVDALVLGRGTYETALGFDAWPYDGKRCVVLTHATQATRSPKHGEEFHEGALPPLLARLRASGVRRVYVDGGAVIRAFLAEGLIDDMTLSLVPILLGEGVPLFGKGTPECRLHLEESRAFASGLVQSRFRISPAFV